jgi:hypothetical protein
MQEQIKKIQNYPRFFEVKDFPKNTTQAIEKIIQELKDKGKWKS